MAGRKLFIVSSINSGERIVKRMISIHLMRESGGGGGTCGRGAPPEGKDSTPVGAEENHAGGVEGKTHNKYPPA